MAEGEKQVTQAGKNKKSIYTKLEDKYYSLMDFVDQKIKLPAYKIFVNPLENHGIPSFPVFILIILALIVGVGFLLAAGAPQKVPFEVSVFSEGKPIDGALVTLNCINGFNAEAYSENGVASFTNVPQTQCTATVEKEGFETRELSLTPSADKKTARATLLALGVTGKEAQVAVQVADVQGAPVTAALVSYEFADQSGSGATDENGKYAFTATTGATVKVFVSKPEYDSIAESFAAAEGAVKQITLKKTAAITDPRLLSKGNVVPQPNDGVNSQGTGSTEYGRVVVKVSASDGSNVSYAKVKLYDDATKSLINSAKATSTQNAEFLAVAVGKKVFVIVESDAYAQYKSATKTVTRSRTQFDAVLQAQIQATCDPAKKTCKGGGHEVKCDDKSGKCTDNGKPADRAPDGAVIVNTTNGTATLAIFLEVSLADQNNKSVSAASVTLLDNDNAPRYNDKTSAKGVVLFSNLSVGTFFTIMAYKDAYLPFWSEQFEAGKILYYNGTLLRADENNSATVKVKARSYNGTPVAKAAVALFVNNRLWDYQGAKTTGSDGVVSYVNVPVGANASINVSTSDGFIASNKTKVVKGENVLEAVLLTPPVTVTFKAVDFITGKEVTANLSLYVPQYGSGTAAFVDNCTASPSKPCTKDLYTLVPYKIVADGENYAEVTDSFVESDASVNKTSKTIQLFRKSDELVQFVGLYEDAGLSVEHQGNLTVGNRYYASFLLQTLNGSNKTVFFVRAGKKPNVLADQAAIIKLDADNGNAVFSKAYDFKLKAGKAINDCAGRTPDAEGLYKWVEAELPASNYSSGLMRFSVPILALESQPAKFKLYYRAYAVLNNSNLLIDPAGDDITTSTVDSKRCDWNASEENFTVENTTSYYFTCKPSGNGCLNVSFAQRQSNGKTIAGGDGFAVRINTTSVEEDDLSVSFNVKYYFNPPLDEDQKATVSIVFPTKNFQYAGADPKLQQSKTLQASRDNIAAFDFVPGSENSFSGKVWAAAIDATNGGATITTSVTYGGAENEVVRADNNLLLIAPEGAAQFAPLPQGYYLKFNKDYTDLQLFGYNDTKFEHPLNAIDLYADPVFPADAVVFKLYAFDLPRDCPSVDLFIQTSTQEDSPRGSFNCLDYDTSNMILKYDASKADPFGKGACAAYDSNPNEVKNASINLTILTSCTLTGKPRKVTVRVHSNNQYPALSLTDAGFIGYGGDFHQTAAFQVLVNNKQRGAIEPLSVIYGKESGKTEMKSLGDLQNERIKVIALNSRVPGPEITPVSSTVADFFIGENTNITDSLSKEIPSMGRTSEVVLETVFRRADFSDTATQFQKSFPASAFEDQQGIEIHWPSAEQTSLCSERFALLDNKLNFSGGEFYARNLDSPRWSQTTQKVLEFNPENYFQPRDKSCQSLYGTELAVQKLCGKNYGSCEAYCLFPMTSDNEYASLETDSFSFIDGEAISYVRQTKYEDTVTDLYIQSYLSYNGAITGLTDKVNGDLKVGGPKFTPDKNPVKGLVWNTCTLAWFKGADWCARKGVDDAPGTFVVTPPYSHPPGQTTIKKLELREAMTQYWDKYQDDYVISTWWETYGIKNPVTNKNGEITLCKGDACTDEGDAGTNCGGGSEYDSEKVVPQGDAGNNGPHTAEQLGLIFTIQKAGTPQRQACMEPAGESTCPDNKYKDVPLGCTACDGPCPADCTSGSQKVCINPVLLYKLVDCGSDVWLVSSDSGIGSITVKKA